MCGSDKPGGHSESMVTTLVCLARKLEMRFSSVTRMARALVSQELKWKSNSTNFVIRSREKRPAAGRVAS